MLNEAFAVPLSKNVISGSDVRFPVTVTVLDMYSPIRYLVAVALMNESIAPVLG